MQNLLQKEIELDWYFSVILFFAASSGLFRSGSKSMAGGGADPTDALFDAIEHGNLERVVELTDANIITKFNT